MGVSRWRKGGLSGWWKGRVWLDGESDGLSGWWWVGWWWKGWVHWVGGWLARTWVALFWLQLDFRFQTSFRTQKFWCSDAFWVWCFTFQDSDFNAFSPCTCWLLEWCFEAVDWFIDLKKNCPDCVMLSCVLSLRLCGSLVCFRHCWSVIAPWDCQSVPQTVTPHMPTPTTRTNPSTSTSYGGTKKSSSRFALTGWPC